MSNARVAVTIVTYNSERYIEGCLQRALAQDHQPLEVIVVDNDSKDATPALLGRFEDRVRVVRNQVNTGFAAAQNQAIRAAANATEWFLTLNPDVRLQPDFVSALLRASGRAPRAGSVCGKLLSASPDFSLASPPLIDSTGITFTPSLRHFDRGNGAADLGQYDKSELVFGGSGAACLYRKATIEDVSHRGEFFDEDFFAYREDADVAWRAQLLGWQCVYTSDAVALHVRAVTPDVRRSLPAIINMHSVKNRWLMRIKNITPDLYRRLWLPVTLRDLVVIAGCLLGEWTSLRAFPLLWRLLPRTVEKRADLQRRRRADHCQMARWFSHEPVSFPLSSEDAG